MKGGKLVIFILILAVALFFVFSGTVMGVAPKASEKQTVEEEKPEPVVVQNEVNVPEIKMPEIVIPEITIPEIKMPEIVVNVPEIQMPEIVVNVPETQVTVQTEVLQAAAEQPATTAPVAEVPAAAAEQPATTPAAEVPAATAEQPATAVPVAEVPVATAEQQTIIYNYYYYGEETTSSDEGDDTIETEIPVTAVVNFENYTREFFHSFAIQYTPLSWWKSTGLKKDFGAIQLDLRIRPNDFIWVGGAFGVTRGNQGFALAEVGLYYDRGYCDIAAGLGMGLAGDFGKMPSLRARATFDVDLNVTDNVSLRGGIQAYCGGGIYIQPMVGVSVAF